MPTTPNLGLPYPAATDVPNVPVDLSELALAIDDAVVPAPAVAGVEGDVLTLDAAGDPVWLENAGGGAAAIDFRNPGQVSGAGNCFPTVLALTSWEAWVWAFLPNVDGDLYGVAKAAAVVESVVLEVMANATTGVARLQAIVSGRADGESLNSFTSTAVDLDVAVPATARLRTRVAFDVSGAGIVAGDLVVVRVRHLGTHTNDTLAVNLELVGGWLE